MILINYNGKGNNFIEVICEYIYIFLFLLFYN